MASVNHAAALSATSLPGNQPQLRRMWRKLLIVFTDLGVEANP
jgi:hypothetical protein